MDVEKYMELQEIFTQYLAEKKLRKTEERYAILKSICSFSGHFDVAQLYRNLEEINFHVSRATLYNTLDLLVGCKLIVRHQLQSPAVQYELRIHAETHSHLICTECGMIREIKDNIFKKCVKELRITRFTPEYYAVYIYGLCSKCKFRLQQKRKKQQR